MAPVMSLSRRPLSFILAAAALAWAGSPAQAASAVVTTPEVRAELTAQALQGVAPGQTVWLGLEIQHQPGWHTYWKNPGDSGLPSSLQWQLPAQVSAGEIAWPTPKKLPVGPLLNYGYEGRLLLPVPLKIGPGFAAATLPVRLHAEWLVCKEVCIPEQGDFALDVPAQAATVGSDAFATAFAALPQTVAAAQASARIVGTNLVVSVAGLPAAWQGRPIDFLPEAAGVIANAAAPEASWQGSTWNAKIAIDPQRSAGPAILPAVLSTPGQAAGVALQVKVESPWPPIAAAAPLPPITVAAANPAPPAPATAAAGGLALTLALALAGGLLLNLMPCVFPVLSLKVLSFAAHAHDRSKLVAGAVAYLVGVVLSFMALAGLLLALRAGGEQLGWGFQLQQPAVVAALALLFTLIGLNLAGVFDFGSLLPSSWASARARHPLVDSLLTGVLAVAVASPCTAPFMGASLGVAVTLPAAQALAVFAALGVGMALPMLLASLWPALADALPRPGPWMVHVRGLLAFPMFATVVWLVWVL
ncbi:MAG: protein-disulfide reductase, partial [Burkholderiales bacterium]|nr:protein-disulfide reductase [Burkholderiales bacterium]